MMAGVVFSVLSGAVVLPRLAAFLVCIMTLGSALAFAGEPKPGRYTGTMTVTYRSTDTGGLGVANKVTYKVSGEGTPSSDPATPGIVLYMMAPPLPGEIVPSRAKITYLSFRVDPPSLTYHDDADNPVTVRLPLANLPV